MKKGLKLITLAMCMAITNTACGRSTSDVENTPDEKEQLLIWSYYETEAQANGLDQLTAMGVCSNDRIRKENIQSIYRAGASRCGNY